MGVKQQHEVLLQDTMRNFYTGKKSLKKNDDIIIIMVLMSVYFINLLFGCFIFILINTSHYDKYCGFISTNVVPIFYVSLGSELIIRFKEYKLSKALMQVLADLQKTIFQTLD